MFPVIATSFLYNKLCFCCSPSSWIRPWIARGSKVELELYTIFVGRIMVRDVLNWIRVAAMSNSPVVLCLQRPNSFCGERYEKYENVHKTGQKSKQVQNAFKCICGAFVWCIDCACGNGWNHCTIDKVQILHVGLHVELYMYACVRNKPGSHAIKPNKRSNHTPPWAHGGPWDLMGPSGTSRRPAGPRRPTASRRRAAGGGGGCRPAAAGRLCNSTWWPA